MSCRHCIKDIKRFPMDQVLCELCIDKEEWKPIEWMPKYLVSSFGRVKNIKTGRILKFDYAGRPNYRYLCVTVSKHGKRYRPVVHRLVYIAFNGPIAEGLHVDHIDRDRYNNTVANLICLTPSDNMKKRCYCNVKNEEDEIVY